jgi:hypothetical protein
MIPNHKQFIEAVRAKRKVWVRFYSQADGGVLDRVCAPMDYGPGGESQNGLHHYWLWDYTSSTSPHTLVLAPHQIVDLQVLGEVFDPAQLEVRPCSGPSPGTGALQPNGLMHPATYSRTPHSGKSRGNEAQIAACCPFP